MIIGFSGTQQGMTKEQKGAVNLLLTNISNKQKAHHGDCIGADADFHSICQDIGLSIIKHPPDNPKSRAFCKGGQEKEPKPYLIRNMDIATTCDILIICPKGFREVRRSGTWATYRYAKRRNKEIYVIYPDGTIIGR